MQQGTGLFETTEISTKFLTFPFDLVRAYWRLWPIVNLVILPDMLLVGAYNGERERIIQ